jgi:hypothetical protein
MTLGARLDQATKRALLARLEQDALRICARFGLRYRVLEAERANVKRRYGVCFSDGTIRIRLRHVATGQPLKYSSLVNTLCHELAHLRHFNHGPQFQAFYARILECARREGIYRPRAAGVVARPVGGGDLVSAAPPPRVAAERAPASRRRAPAREVPAPVHPIKAAQLELFGPTTAQGSIRARSR